MKGSNGKKNLVIKKNEMTKKKGKGKRKHYGSLLQSIVDCVFL